MVTTMTNSIKSKVVPLSQGYVSIVSEGDYKRVSQYSWHVHFSKGAGRKYGYPYARATIKGKKVYLHRFIMRAEGDLQPDHRNHCTLDNRRENLEMVPNEENQKRRRSVDKPKRAIVAIKKIKEEGGLSLDTLTCLNRLYEILK